MEQTENAKKQPATTMDKKPNGESRFMDGKMAITILVPPKHPALLRELRDTMKKQHCKNIISFKKSPDDDCHLKVHGDISSLEVWWPINRLVLAVERKHHPDWP